MWPSSPTISPGGFGRRRNRRTASPRVRQVRPAPGASLVEIVITLLILGLLAALVIPRFSRAAPESRPDLRENLRRFRVAIELYRQDHGRYPGRTAAAGRDEPPAPAVFVAQLTEFSDRDGVTSPARSERFRFGPYLRRPIPPLGAPPDFEAVGVLVIHGDEVPAFRALPGIGWVYNRDTGDIAANSNAHDESGTPLDRY